MFFSLFSAATLFLIPERQCATLPPASTSPTPPPGCTWDGQWYPEGEFKPDPCTFCNCDSGQATCAVAGCTMPQCVDAVQDPTQCCPTCPNGSNCLGADGSTIIKMGEEVTIGNETCHCDTNNLNAVCFIAA